MNILKRLVGILGVLVGLIVVALAIFLVTFDADRYRPMLVGKLQEAIGHPVKLQRLSLGWRAGLAVQLQGLVIPDEERAAGEPLIEIDSISALVRLLPLLQKDVQVSSLLLTRPRIHIVRDSQGRINLLGLAVAASPAAASQAHARVGDAAVSFQIASLRIEDGTLHWRDLSAAPGAAQAGALTQPPAEIWLKRLAATVRHIAPGQPMDIDAGGALAAEATNIHVSGRLTPPSPAHPGALEAGTLTVDTLPLDHLLPAAGPGSPHLEGKLTIALQGGVATFDPTQIRRAISASGRLKLTELRVANLNVLRAVFEKLSVLPGLMQALEARLPPSYQAKLADTDTVLSPVDLSVQVEGGVLRCDDLRVRSDTFELAGAGQIGLEGTVNIHATVRVEPSLSAAMITSVNELQALTNAQGNLELPVVIQERPPYILPDLHYLASKLLSTKVQGLLGQFLQRALDRAGPRTP